MFQWVCRACLHVHAVKVESCIACGRTNIEIRRDSADLIKVAPPPPKPASRPKGEPTVHRMTEPHTSTHSVRKATKKTVRPTRSSRLPFGAGFFGAAVAIIVVTVMIYQFTSGTGDANRNNTERVGSGSYPDSTTVTTHGADPQGEIATRSETKVDESRVVSVEFDIVPQTSEHYRTFVILDEVGNIVANQDSANTMVTLRPGKYSFYFVDASGKPFEQRDGGFLVP